MESAAEREVFQGSLTLGLWPSPSGSAVLVTTRDGTVALDAATGTPLHEAWSSKSWAVRWVDSSDDARVVQLRPCGRSDKPRILDLDDGTEFEIDRDISQLLLRLGARGYVYVRNGGDLVWVDSRGELVKVLVDR
jgi:hypothetical protein